MKEKKTNQMLEEMMSFHQNNDKEGFESYIYQLSEKEVLKMKGFGEHLSNVMGNRLEEIQPSPFSQHFIH